MKSISSILIANRGEIAVRIIRACREMGIRSVAVYSDPDRTSLHVESADEAYRLPGASAAETYLNQTAILAIASLAKADAIHPGYGFLSENPSFARAVIKQGLIFIGPGPDAISLLGDKTQARALASSLGIPIVAGSGTTVDSTEDAARIADAVGFPLLIKASAGGGGKGMRVVETPSNLSSSWQLARSEAQNAFGDPRVYFERHVVKPRHVEIQILADTHGNVVYLGERDCTIQRRHQKVIEESPSPGLPDATRVALGNSAVAIARAAGYSNAGTVEFLLDQEGKFYFLEVNARLQVEHPISEAVTGIDIVHQQISLAQGKDLPFQQGEISPRGHAIECRIYAEDPENDFLPSTGKLFSFTPPLGPRTRVDSGARTGDEVNIYYDALLAKVITWGETREDSCSAMVRALREFGVHGVNTTIPFCIDVLNHDVFIQGLHTTDFVSQQLGTLSMKHKISAMERDAAALAAVLFQEVDIQKRRVNGIAGRSHPGKAWKDKRFESYR